jgi:hypothetical protein
LRPRDKTILRPRDKTILRPRDKSSHLKHSNLEDLFYIKKPKINKKNI